MLDPMLFLQDAVCIYHKNCLDGFAAFWSFHRAQEDRVLNPVGIPFGHGDTIDLETITDKHVVIVDFSFKRATMRKIAARCKSLTVIDHHESAERELYGLEEELGEVYSWTPIKIIFDMEKSGALLTWEHFHKTPPPRIIELVSDGDLWRFEMAATRAVKAALFLYPFDLPTWDRLFGTSDADDNLHMLEREGIALLRKQDRDVIAMAKSMAYLTNFAGFEVPVANAPFTVASDLGNLLCKGHPFSVTYFRDSGGMYKVSLRSDKNDPTAQNVSRIAERFGGGGHRNAAGFLIRELDFERSAVWVPEPDKVLNESTNT